MASSNQYEEAIARAKAALESYSAEAEALARLYETAKQNARTAYETQKEQTSVQAAEDRRQADIDMQRTERNLNQRLASRGLALSGENAQTRLDLLVALRNRLAGIDSDERNRLADLDQAHADRQSELDMDYADHRADRAKQLASMNADLAAAEAKKAAATAAAPSKGDGGSQASSGVDPSSLLKDPASFGETFRTMAKNLTNKLMGHPVDLTDGNGQKGSVVPEVSARNLATQLVKAAGSSGRISGSRQQASLSSLLDALLSTVELDSNYYDELMLNLRSLGYRPDYAQTVDENAVKMQKDSRDVYDQSFRRYYNVYCRAGEAESDAARLAEQDARYMQLRYLYTHSSDADEFDYVVDSLQLNSYLNEFYERRSKDSTKVKLGGAL